MQRPIRLRKRANKKPTEFVKLASRFDRKNNM